MRATLIRLLAATPDALTALAFALAWTRPDLFGAQHIRDLMLVMLIEFLVVHSSGFYAGILALGDLGRARLTLMYLALAAFYMLFILAFSLSFDSTWPLWSFGWLMLSRFAHLWLAPADTGKEVGRMMGLWAASVAAYLFGAFATVMLPFPALGITPAVIASLHLSGSGEWIEQPYTVLAFGFIYFGIQALIKYYVSAPARRLSPHTARHRIA